MRQMKVFGRIGAYLESRPLGSAIPPCVCLLLLPAESGAYPRGSLKNLVWDPVVYALHASNLVVVRWGHRQTVPFSHVAGSPATPVRPAVGRPDDRSCRRQPTSLLEGLHPQCSRLFKKKKVKYLDTQKLRALDGSVNYASKRLEKTEVNRLSSLSPFHV